MRNYDVLPSFSLVHFMFELLDFGVVAPYVIKKTVHIFLKNKSTRIIV